LLPILVWHEAEYARELSFVHALSELVEGASAADEEKDDIRMIAQLFGGTQDRIEFMRTPKITRIADDEFGCELPFSAQWIVGCGDRNERFIIAPVRNDCYVIGRYAQSAHSHRHSFADCDVGDGVAQRSVAQRLQSLSDGPSHERNTEG